MSSMAGARSAGAAAWGVHRLLMGREGGLLRTPPLCRPVQQKVPRALAAHGDRHVPGAAGGGMQQIKLRKV